MQGTGFRHAWVNPLLYVTVAWNHSSPRRRPAVAQRAHVGGFDGPLSGPSARQRLHAFRATSRLFKSFWAVEPQSVRSPLPPNDNESSGLKAHDEMHPFTLAVVIPRYTSVFVVTAQDYPISMDTR